MGGSDDSGGTWRERLERLDRGDPAAFLEVAQAVTALLAGWRAFDFRDDWEDVAQEVVLALLLAYRERRLARPEAAFGFLRSATRFKLMDRLRAHLKLPPDRLPIWPDPLETLPPAGPERRADLRRALDGLPPERRRAVEAVYVRGETYPEAARRTGVPLGTLKHHLREGLAQLRRGLGPRFPER